MANLSIFSQEVFPNPKDNDSIQQRVILQLCMQNAKDLELSGLYKSEGNYIYLIQFAFQVNVPLRFWS